MLTDASPLPFVSVTFDGLLWGYQDELPCLPLDAPKECNKGNDPFSSDDDVFEDDGDDWDFKRRKRSLSDKDYRIVEKEILVDMMSECETDGDHEPLTKGTIL